ncbi:MAG: RDD family protein [Cyclobacteriaceae bacterium]|nr:RDD family protein [Cyclobacteriaceae bacterium]
MNQQYKKAGLWRRLTANWIDLFIIYTIVIIVITGMDAMGIRIAVEPLFIILGAIYSVILLIKGHTLGKMLMSISLKKPDGGQPKIKNIIVREMICKWGLLAGMPMLMGRLLLGSVWIPTIFDFLALIPLSFLTLLHYLIFRYTWYDKITNLVIVHTANLQIKFRTPIIILVISACLGFGDRALEYFNNGRLQCQLLLYRNMKPVHPHTEFLNIEHKNAVDYVIGLFDQHDVVVLCERLHPEMTQWDFIYELVSDKRFVNNVGHIFTEYGNITEQSNLDNFMSMDNLSKDEVDNRIVHIMRNWAVWPMWTNTNFYKYLNRLYRFNQTLPIEKRVRHHFSDGPVVWSELETSEQYQDYRRSLYNRDELMANIVITEMKYLNQNFDKPAKCLVIQNYRHAFDLTKRNPNSKRINTYEFIKDAFEERAANVLMCSYSLFVPIAGNLWDDAFDKADNPRIGFNLKESPFGKEAFDLFPFQIKLKGLLNYSDVFTGLVYTHPLTEQYISNGIPGYFDGFEKEVLRRSEFFGTKYLEGTKRSIEYSGNIPSTRKLTFIETILELLLLGIANIGFVIAFINIIIRFRGKREVHR